MTRNNFRELVELPIDGEDEARGCFVHFEVNGLEVKLVKCDTCELVHVYAKDKEDNEIGFTYEYVTGDTKQLMVKKVSGQLVSMQQAYYMAQKKELKQSGYCVKH